MQNETPDRQTQTTDLNAVPRAFAALTELCERQRKLRIRLQPRRPSCHTRRAMIAALREAELSAWMRTGGDYLVSVRAVRPGVAGASNGAIGSIIS